MPWTAPDHEKSAIDAINLGLMRGVLSVLADVPEPFQSNQHQARVTSITTMYALGGPTARADVPWSSTMYDWSTPPPPPGGWGDGVAFGNRTLQTDVLHIDGMVDDVIDGLFFDGYNPGGSSPFQHNGQYGDNSHVCILLSNCRNVTIRNVDFNQVSQPFALFDCDTILVEDSRALDITGPSERFDAQTGNFLQTGNRGSSNIRVINNKLKGGDTEDMISLYGTAGGEVAYNQVDNGNWDSASGTGIIVSDGGGSDQWVHHNTLLNPGQVGIAIAGGVNGLVEENIIYHDGSIAMPPDAGDIAAYCSNYYPDDPFDSNAFRRNRAMWVTKPGGFWNPGGAIDDGNVWDDTTIDPTDLQVVL